MFGLGSLDWIADKPTLEDHGEDYRTNSARTSGEEGLWVGAKDSVSHPSNTGSSVNNTSRIQGLTALGKLRIFPIPFAALSKVSRAGWLSVTPSSSRRVSYIWRLSPGIYEFSVVHSFII